MKETIFKSLALILFLFIFLAASLNIAEAKRSENVVIGHPACLSGKYAKAGEQAVGGIKACIEWVNNEYGRVKSSMMGMM